MSVRERDANQRDEDFARQAIALACEARRAGNHPFGALLVLDGAVVLTAANTVTTDRDPTAHAETNLVADAIRRALVTRARAPRPARLPDSVP